MPQSRNNSETTYAASALKADTLNATLMRGDTPAHNQDGVHYRYVGTMDTHRLYISSKANALKKPVRLLLQQPLPDHGG